MARIENEYQSSRELLCATAGALLGTPLGWFTHLAFSVPVRFGIGTPFQIEGAVAGAVAGVIVAVGLYDLSVGQPRRALAVLGVIAVLAFTTVVLPHR